MSQYISSQEAADKWGVSRRRVSVLCSEERIPGAILVAGKWLIPTGAEKPGDPRFRKKEAPEKSLSAEIMEIIEAGAKPLPHDNPDSVLDDIQDKNLKLYVKMYLDYLRGDFEQTKQCFHNINDDEAVKLLSCPMGIAAAISTGDYPFFQEIESYCKDMISKDRAAETTAIAEFAIAAAYSSMFAHNMIPDWLKNGDFLPIPALLRPTVVCFRTRYLLFMKKYEAVLDIARTTLLFNMPESGTTYAGLYLRIHCAVAYRSLGRVEEAKTYLLSVMKDCLRHGFITPFTEFLNALGGMTEELLEREYPEYSEPVISQWNHTIPNWISFHNRFTKENITSILSRKDFQMALMAAQDVPFKEIAEQYHISLGTLNNNMQTIYQKLSISNKKELSQYVF